MKYIKLLCDLRNKINDIIRYESLYDKNIIADISKLTDSLYKEISDDSKNPISSDLFDSLFSATEKYIMIVRTMDSDSANHSAAALKKIISILWKLEFEILNLPVSYLKGIGPKRSVLFQKRGIQTILNLIFYFPEKFNYYTPAFINTCEINGEYILSGKITEIKKHFIPGQKSSYMDIKINDGSGIVTCRFFGNFHYYSHISKDIDITVRGKMEYYNTKIIINPKYTLEKTDILKASPEILPHYSIPNEIRQSTFRRTINSAIEEYLGILTDFLPLSLRKANGFICLRECVKKIHNPVDFKETEFLKQQISYYMFYNFQMFLQLQKKKLRSTKIPAFYKKNADSVLDNIIHSLPFSLTQSQISAFNEICADLESAFPMRRLLQGDVGCGKTIVAIFACVIAAGNGCQSAIMAPSEILARQHFDTFSKYLQNTGYKICLLTSKLTIKQKNEIAAKISDGYFDFIIGTHSIIQDGVKFCKPGIAIIDEQHRFGVEQRAALYENLLFPHILLMSATPIPRTLGQTILSDFDISIIDQKPEGRIPPITKIFHEKNKTQLFEIINKNSENNLQTFIVYPVIDDSETLNLKPLINEFNKISETYLSGSKCAMIHGKMPKDEIENIMNDFISNRINTLFTTIIIEVGVDIPAASIIIIENPERFGLAQLHQLRGRVGRNTHQSYCYLVINDNTPGDSLERINFFSGCSDGFKLAQFDLSDRGIGDLAGIRQSGFSSGIFKDFLKYGDMLLKIKDLCRDTVNSLEFDNSYKSEYFRIFSDNIKSKTYGEI